MKVHFYEELDKRSKAEWKRFWNQCRHSHPRQHLLFGEVERAKGRTPIYAVAEDEGALVCIGIFSIRPLFFGRRFSLEAVCLRGPTFDDVSHGREFLSQIVSRFRELKVGIIRVSPYWFYPEAALVRSMLDELGFIPYGGCSPKGSTGLVDLQPNDDDIFASLSKSTRREIRRAERQNITIRPASNSNETVAFFQHLSQMNRECAVMPVSYDEFRATFQYILKSQQIGVLLNAFWREEFLGGLWIVRGPLAAHTSRYVVAPEALRELSNLSIGPVLWWSGIMWAKAKGCRWLDVEGYQNNIDPSDVKYLVYRFKKKFKPKPIEILAQHTYRCSPVTYSISKGYSLVCRGWGFARGLPYGIRKRLDIRRLIRSED